MCGEKTIFDTVSNELSDFRKKTLDMVEDFVEGEDVVHCPTGLNTCPKTGKKCFSWNSAWEKTMQELSAEVTDLEMKIGGFFNGMF